MKLTNRFNKLVAAAILTGCAYAPQTFADTDSVVGMPWYFGVGITASDLSFNDKNLSTMYSGNADSTFSHSGNAFKLFGGYQFDPLLSMEFGYTSFGEIVMTNDEAKRNLFDVDGAYVSAIATQPISKNVDVLAKGGMFFWSLNDSDDNSIEDGQGLTYGAGLNINFYGNKERSLLIEWEHYSFSGVALKEADSIGASLKFKFR